MTCNTTEDIEHTISFIWKNLASHGRFFGLDWQSTKHDDYHQQEGAYLDAKTRVFQTGHFAGMGAMHFVDQNDLARLFRGGRFLYLTEKIEQHYMPDRHQSAAWDFVVEKAEGTDE